MNDVNKQSGQFVSHKQGATANPGKAQKIELELVQLLYQQAPQALGSSFIVALILAGFLWQTANHEWLLVWVSMLLLVTILRGLLMAAFRRADVTIINAERWGSMYTAGAFFAGICWGSVAILWSPEWSVSHQVLLFIALAGVSAGAISSNAPQLSTFAAFLFPLLLPFAGILLAQNGGAYAGMGLLLLLYPSLLFLIARNYHKTIRESLGYRFENQSLLNELSEQVEQLQDEVVTRKKFQSELNQLNQTLELRVTEHTRGLHEEIARRTRIESKLEQAVNRNQSILDAAGEGIFGLDKDGSISFINPAGVKMLGWEPEELIGLNQHMVIHHTRADGSPHPHQECPVNDTLQTGQEQHVDKDIFWRKDGSSVLVEYFSTPIMEGDEVVGAVITFIDISERKYSENALIESERKFSAIAESAQDAIIMMDDTGEVVYWNRAAEQITGYSKSEAMGNNLHQLIVPERFIQAHEQAFPHFIATGKGMAVGKTLELASVRKGGEEFPVELSISTVRLQGHWHAIGMLRDISKRKQAEADLRKSRNTYQTLVDNLPQRIFYKDNNSVYISSNRQYARDLGIAVSELPGKSDFDIFPTDLAERYRLDDRRIIESGEIEDIEEPYLRDGEERYIHTVKTPIKDEEGNPAGILAIFWDITEQKQAEKERQNLEVQLRQAQKLEAVGQLAAGIAHEINTPTQFVSDNTRFLQETFEDYGRLLVAYEQLAEAAASGNIPQQLVTEVKALEKEIDADYLKQETPQAIEQSLEGLERISRIVQAMKEFSHPGMDEKTPTNLNRAIESTIDVSRNEWKYCSALITELDPTLPQVPVLPGEFNQVILNLIVNAAHAITDVVGNSGKMGEIRISTRLDGEWVEITISDTGKGIPEAIQKRIFDPFFTTKEVGKGSGQGLAISWSFIVDKHGGSIDVESEEDKGTTFTIRLPITQDKIS